MKILTISASPYLLTNLGRLNGDILKYLSSVGHSISSAVWHHDLNFFMPGEDGTSRYEDVCQLFPFENGRETSPIAIYETIKMIEPDVVITIGDYHEISILKLVKDLLPNTFKWVAIMTGASEPINDSYIPLLDGIDLLFLTNSNNRQQWSDIIKDDINIRRLGLSEKRAGQVGKLDKFSVLGVGKNSHISNLSSFISGAGSFSKLSNDTGVNDIDIRLHTNLHDPGDYNLSSLVNRYGDVKLPEDYVSVNQGLTDDKMGEIYANTTVIVDASMRSATAMTVLEAMSYGCIPLIPPVGAFADIIEELKNEGLDQINFSLKGVKFVSEREEELYIVDPDSIKNELCNIYNTWMIEKEILKKIRGKISEIAKRIYTEDFVIELDSKIKELVENTSMVLKIEENF